ncbi:hypothetical protein A2866_01250 [Candidatus Roizmanbacteria bacterium RIFCSPHIGHO2_01_FULL_39_8]|uniref:Four helix bundle protein n=3 Tax=Candidatus Roizmaniibacteriota TaxID=1752723 RepID=A0A1F7GKW3_9BACT|nr:MAG: hypothetical protein A2866_01250 [Candidatus Roizmanbacteria bacterium RIFCSPHIGHO2_01_FULL_39_8]OGK28456.1 MAG: hypothetical protein A3C28_04035 [Candidatus Roizmanbacteria bacterium RIFCSPHIGHO2_02_FULL_39_9]OGK37620.1 MAG: hypothetical protein A3F60_01870 [Candidatus Roizmanbacteria bacterium RIFCSPHIGHO2_12_FULL_39_8]
MNVELTKKQQFKQEFKKRCFLFSISILRLSEKLNDKRINWVLIDQLIRAATSVGANIVEGGNSTSKREFVNFFQIALKSSSESLYWLAILKEMNLEKKDEIHKLIQECSEIKKIISTIILNTKTNSRF